MEPLLILEPEWSAEDRRQCTAELNRISQALQGAESQAITAVFVSVSFKQRLSKH